MLAELCKILSANDISCGFVRLSYYSQYPRVGAVHCFSNKVLLERAIASVIIQQGDIPVRRKRSWPDLPSVLAFSVRGCCILDIQHRDIPEYTFQRLIQDVTHFILEVLRSHERVDEIPPKFPFQRYNLAACSSD